MSSYSVRRLPSVDALLRRVTMVAAGICLLAAPALGQGDPTSQSAPRIFGQLAMGTVLTPVGFFGAGWATKHAVRRRGWTDEGASRAAFVAAYSGAWLAAASGPIAFGRDGSKTAALGGSLAGIGAAALSVRLGNRLWDDDRRSCGLACWTLGAVTVALPSIGATVAYAASRR